MENEIELNQFYLELVNQYLVDELGLGSRFIGDSSAKGRRAIGIVGHIVRVMGLGAVTTSHRSAATAPSQRSTRYHLRARNTLAIFISFVR